MKRRHSYYPEDILCRETSVERRYYKITRVASTHIWVVEIGSRELDGQVIPWDTDSGKTRAQSCYVDKRGSVKIKGVYAYLWGANCELTLEYRISDHQFVNWAQEVRELFFDGIAEMNVGTVTIEHPYPDWTTIVRLEIDITGL